LRADVGFSYKPFLSILGTGLVTSEGAAWKKQRLLISKAFRCALSTRREKSWAHGRVARARSCGVKKAT
jgi:hypothetical protein